jgi:hypothetical protein
VLPLPFSHEINRAASNLAQYYEAWLSAGRELRDLPYGMSWKHSSGKDYLYALTDRLGNGKSLGPRSADTEAIHKEYLSAKEDASAREKEAARSLRESAQILRALRAPLIFPAAAAILREAALRSMLGTDLITVGTVAMTAYQYEAVHYLATGLDATADFDLAWTGRRGLEVALAASSPAPVCSVLSLLKTVDSTYTVNTERPFQARNRHAFEIELLMAPSVAKFLPPSEPLRPHPLPEQEWLLQGRLVQQVVPASDGTAAMLVVPDPRWFALHKLWLADKPGRNPLKVPKDRKQGLALLEAIALAMPRFPLDDAFLAALPAELEKYLPEVEKSIEQSQKLNS